MTTTATKPVSRAALVRQDLARVTADVAARQTGNGPRDRWREQANCRGLDPDLFFPERGASTREAKAVCQRCTVWSPCLTEALARGEKHGIWGGLSERERRRLRRDMALPRPPRRKIA